MREIKFRAWDKGTNAWHRFKKLFFEQEEPLELFELGSLDGLVIFEQFTGLLDKNGKEIYEGDVVKVPYNDFGNEVVKWYDCGKWNISVYDVAKLSVIGNVHSNPDLIGG